MSVMKFMVKYCVLMNNVSNDRIVNKYRDDPWTMQHVNRHFYTEKVFDDST